MIVENYLPYISLSKNPQNDSYVFKEMLEAQQKGFKKLPTKIKDGWDNWVSEKIGLSVEDMWQYFSAEQIDSIGCAIFKIESGQGFIIGDETGKGKGRILAGISRYAKMNDLNVLFFTERTHLFSDFWRDVINTKTNELIDNVLIMHNKGEVYDQNNELVFKGKQKEIQKFIDGEDFNGLIMTTYSQISLVSHKKTKGNALEKFINKKGIVILDESHNAVGDSNTKKFLEKLLVKAKGVVFSSATFLKNENEFDIYESVIGLSSIEFKLLQETLGLENNYILRKFLTNYLTENLCMLRREHEPANIEWDHVYVKDDLENYVETYAKIITEIFDLVTLLQQEPSLEKLDVGNVWYEMGADVSRLSQNLLLVLKIPTLIEKIKEKINANEKCVVVIDSTFNSLIKQVIDFHKNLKPSMGQSDEDAAEDDFYEEKEGELLNFAEILKWVAFEVVGQHITPVLDNPDIEARYNILSGQFDLFNDLTLSPIDKIKESLLEFNISSGEISGRTHYTERIDNTNLFNIKKFSNIPRSKIVARFNNGEDNVIIITRAGASGLSLHASRDFKDQRKRNLFELEITKRPTFRLQFIGRVRRKNQVLEPSFFTISTSLPFEKRILSVEQDKLKKLQSHISGDDEKLDNENIIDFYNHVADQLAHQFLLSKASLAFKLGINLKTKSKDFYFIDSLLKRCIVLTKEQQELIFNYLITGLEINKKTESNYVSDNIINVESINSFWSDLTDKQKEDFRDEYNIRKDKNYFLNTVKFPWTCLVEGISKYKSNSSLSIELEKNIQKDYTGFIGLEFVKTFLSAIMKFEKYEVKQEIAQKLKKLQNIYIGQYLKIDIYDKRVFGYVEKIEIPKHELLFSPHHYLIKLRTINPSLNNKVNYYNDVFYMTLYDLLFNVKDINYYDNQSIDFSMFERNNKDIEVKRYFWMGNPIWTNYLRHAYGVGDAKEIFVENKKLNVVELPNFWNASYVKNLQKPIYDFNNIMDKLINKEIRKISNYYLKDEMPSIRVEPTTGGYNVFISHSLVQNRNFFDFGMKKFLNDFKADKHYEIHFVPFKKIRMVLAMLEKRQVYWFIVE